MVLRKRRGTAYQRHKIFFILYFVWNYKCKWATPRATPGAGVPLLDSSFKPGSSRQSGLSIILNVADGFANH